MAGLFDVVAGTRAGAAVEGVGFYRVCDGEREGGEKAAAWRRAVVVMENFILGGRYCCRRMGWSQKRAFVGHMMWAATRGLRVKCSA